METKATRNKQQICFSALNAALMYTAIQGGVHSQGFCTCEPNQKFN
jgi:hypothetical protein